jgi:hypothetical protein
LTKPGEYKVPYDARGNLLHYACIDKYFNEDNSTTQLRDNAVFLASMEIQEGITRGRSAKYVHLKDVESGALYPMFVVDLVDAISRGSVRQGIFPATYWRVQKRGQNYGIRRAKANEI